MNTTYVAVLCLLVVVIAVAVYMYMSDSLPPVTYNLTSIDATNSGLPLGQSVVYTADPANPGRFNSSTGPVLLVYKDASASASTPNWYAVCGMPADIAVLSSKLPAWEGFGILCLNTDTSVTTDNINFVQYSGLTAGTNVVSSATLASNTTTPYTTTKTNLVATTTAPPANTTTNVGTVALSWKAAA